VKFHSLHSSSILFKPTHDPLSGIIMLTANLLPTCSVHNYISPDLLGVFRVEIPTCDIAIAALSKQHANNIREEQMHQQLCAKNGRSSWKWEETSY